MRVAPNQALQPVYDMVVAVGGALGGGLGGGGLGGGGVGGGGDGDGGGGGLTQVKVDESRTLNQSQAVVERESTKNTKEPLSSSSMSVSTCVYPTLPEYFVTPFGPPCLIVMITPSEWLQALWPPTETTATKRKVGAQSR